MSEPSEKTYEMLWDCKYCGTKKLLGLTHRHCPGCGAPQDPTLRYFPSDAEKIAVQDHVFAGRDRVCAACQNPCSARANNCGNCGSPLDKAKDVGQRADQVHAEGQAFAGETKEAAKAEHAQPVQQPPPVLPETTPRARSSKLPIILGLCGLTLFAILFATCIWKKPVTLTVVGHSWQREVEIERFSAKSDSAWCDQMPADATGVSRTKEVRSQKKVQDGETCATRRKDNGDGTFKEVRECSPKYRDEPVYDQKCSYRVNRWGHERTEKAQGGLKDLPAWPTVRLGQTGTTLGAEREGQRSETYTVSLRDGSGSSHDCPFNEAKWSSMQEGSKWSGKEAVLTGSVSCDSLVATK